MFILINLFNLMRGISMKRFIIAALCMVTLTSSSLLCMEQQAISPNDLTAAQNMLKELTILPVKLEAPCDGKGYEITVLAGYLPDDAFLQVTKAKKNGRIEYRGCTFKDGETVRNPITVDAQIFESLLEKLHSHSYQHIFAVDYHFLQIRNRINDSGARRWYAECALGGYLFAEKCATSKDAFRAEIQHPGQPKIVITGEEARVLFVTLAYCYTAGWYKKVDTKIEGGGDPYLLFGSCIGTQLLPNPYYVEPRAIVTVHKKYAWQESKL